jgi:magnesium chelatase family protein
LLDRIDIQVEMPSLSKEEIAGLSIGESSAVIRKRVNEARKFSAERFKDGSGVYCNAKMTARQIRDNCILDESASSLISKAYEAIGLSARGYDRILKVARTIADLDQSPIITALHMGEAIQLRTLDRNYF